MLCASVTKHLRGRYFRCFFVQCEQRHVLCLSLLDYYFRNCLILIFCLFSHEPLYTLHNSTHTRTHTHTAYKQLSEQWQASVFKSNTLIGLSCSALDLLFKKPGLGGGEGGGVGMTTVTRTTAVQTNIYLAPRKRQDHAASVITQIESDGWLPDFSLSVWESHIECG